MRGTESVRRRIGGRCQADLPPRRYPYGPVNAGLAARRNVASFTPCRRKGSERPGRRPPRPSGLQRGFALGALVIEGSLGSNSGKEFGRAPSRTGTLMPQRAAVSAFSKGDQSPPAPHNGGRGRLAFEPFHRTRAPTSRRSLVPDRPEVCRRNLHGKNHLERQSGGLAVRAREPSCGGCLDHPVAAPDKSRK